MQNFLKTLPEYEHEHEEKGAKYHWQICSPFQELKARQKSPWEQQAKFPVLFTNTEKKHLRFQAFKSDNRLSDSWKGLEKNICWNKWNVPWLLWSKFLGLS